MATNLVDLLNNTISPTVAMQYPIAVTTGTTNSSAIDCISAVFPIAVVQTTGVFTSPGTLITTMQYATDDPANPGTALSTSWTALTAQTNFAVTFDTVSTSNTRQILEIEQMPATGRYLRASQVVAGGGASVISSLSVFAQAKITGTGQGFSNSPSV